MVVSTAGAAVLSLVGETGMTLANPIDEAGVTLANGLGIAANPVRRKVLSLLSDRDESTARELARAAVDDEEIPFRSTDRLAIVLHHRCLPQLEEEDYLEYDPDSGTVACPRVPESAPTESDRE